MRIANARHVRSLWRQKHGVEVVVDKEEGAVVPILGNEGRIARPSLGECQRWVAGLCRVHLALGRMDTEMCCVGGRSGQAGENHRSPWLLACDAKMDPIEFRRGM